MKKVIISLLAIAIFASCKKDSDGPELGGVTISINQTGTINVDFTPDESGDKTASFDVVADQAAPEDITAALSILTTTTATEGTHYTLPSTSLTIAKDSNSETVEIQILSDGIEQGDSLVLNIRLASGVAQVGENDMVSIIIKRALPEGAPAEIFSEGFEGGEIPTGWQALDIDGKTPSSGAWFEPATTWIVTDNASAGIHSGTYAAGCNSWVAGDSDVDDWLITSAIDLTTENVLKFYLLSTHGSYPESCQVYISLSSDQSSFSTSIFEVIDLTPGDEWHEFTVNISETYDNQTVYLAFRDFTTGGDALMLDDISITGIVK